MERDEWTGEDVEGEINSRNIGKECIEIHMRINKKKNLAHLIDKVYIVEIGYK